MILPELPRHHLVDVKIFQMRIVQLLHKKRIRMIEHHIYVLARQILLAPVIYFQILHVILKHKDMILRLLELLRMPLRLAEITVLPIIGNNPCPVRIIRINCRRIRETIRHDMLQRIMKRLKYGKHHIRNHKEGCELGSKHVNVADITVRIHKI